MQFNAYFRAAILLKRYYKILCRLFDDSIQMMRTPQLVTKTRLAFLNRLLCFRKKQPSDNPFSILTNNSYFKSLLNLFKHSSIVTTRTIASYAFRTNQRHFFKTVSLLGPIRSSCLRQWFTWRNFTLILSLRLSVILNTMC